MDLLNRALILATEVHDGQQYGEGAYILHPIRVALDPAIAAMGEFAQTAAVLHDVVEDGGADAVARAMHDFGSAMATTLGYLTRWDGEDYHNYIARVAEHQLARAIKRADLRDHLAHQNTLAPSMRYRYEWALTRLS